MDTLFPSHKIYLSTSRIAKAGRGIFSAVDIHKNEVIEQCPVIEIPHDHIPLLKKSELINYYFLWEEKIAICLGFGSLYNHSYSPNATYIKKLKEKVIEFVALADIKHNEEVTVNYNHGDPNDKSPLWIKSIKPPED